MLLYVLTTMMPMPIVVDFSDIGERTREILETVYAASIQFDVVGGVRYKSQGSNNRSTSFESKISNSIDR